MGCGHSSASPSNAISPTPKEMIVTKDSFAANEETLKEEFQRENAHHAGLSRRPSMLNTPHLQTVRETMSNAEDDDSAFKVSEVVAGRKLSYVIHNRSGSNSALHSSANNISEQDNTEKYSPTKFDMEKFRKANSGDLANNDKKNSLEKLGINATASERTASTPAEIKLNAHDESLMDDILASV